MVKVLKAWENTNFGKKMAGLGNFTSTKIAKPKPKPKAKPLPTGKKTAVDLKKSTAAKNKALKDLMK
jgi:hypothetical protein